MAKGNMMLGYSRGSVGDVTFSRLKGQQIAKARNRNPNNPKTKTQMMQRSLFVSATKFYQQARAKFFKFAFEDKKYHESDFNAFMRHNVKNGTNMTQEAVQAYNYPALGLWALSKGSLQPFEQTAVGNTFRANTGIVVPQDYDIPTTVGALSATLIQSNRFQPGDMLTMVNYGFTLVGAAEMPSLAPLNDDYMTYFTYKQMVINTDSTDALTKYDLGVYVDGTTHVLYITSTGEVYDERYVAVCLIHSRQTANGLLVSDSVLLPSALFDEAVKACADDAYIQQVLNAWGATEEAILSPRSLPAKAAPLPSITATMLQTLPWTPQRGSFIKINSDESVDGKQFTVTINGKSYSGTFGNANPFWRSTTDVGLDFYMIDEVNSISVDKKGACPNIESITLKIGGVNVPITLKS